jgi:hypothetical protein
MFSFLTNHNTGSALFQARLPFSLWILPFGMIFCPGHGILRDGFLSLKGKKQKSGIFIHFSLDMRETASLYS